MSSSAFVHVLSSRPVLLIALLGILALAGSAAAYPDLPFEETFDDGTLDGWITGTTGNGWVKVDTVQNVTPRYALHIKSGNSDSARAYPNATYDHSESIIVEFDFRYTGGHHWMSVWRTYETELVLDSGGRLVGWQHYLQKSNYIMTLSANRWYHMVIEYNGTTKMNTIYVDDVQKKVWGYTGGNDLVWVGDFAPSVNNGECFWDNFRIRYWDAPLPPDLISPESGNLTHVTPKLEWEFKDRVTTDYQTAYRVQVADAPDFLDVFYDTGNVSGAGSNVTPPALGYKTWYWRAKVKDGQGLWGIWSDPFNFTMNRTNVPPVWDKLPVLHAVEDVYYTYDFSANITDLDDGPGNLTLSSGSPFVTDIQGFNVTFLFLEGVTEATVKLVVKDIRAHVPVNVSFVVTPVNDPPSHTIPVGHSAMEDVLFTFNATGYVSDVDTPVEDLWLNGTDPYVSVEGLLVTATFPDGVTTHETWLNLTDGEFSVPVQLLFDITPVNDPPVVSDLGTFVAVEDEVSVFNVTPFLHDIDNPVDDLSLIVRSENCTVSGQYLRFLYTVGGLEEHLVVEVTDGRAMVQADLLVRVEERNDAPVVGTVPPQVVTEDSEQVVDLSPYVTDEDDDLGDLTLTCDEAHVTQVQGLNVTLLYAQWSAEHRVWFNISDGALSDEGSFLVQVQSVNDLPVIVGLSELEPPYHVDMDEGTVVELMVLVEDEDNTRFRYSIETSWSGASIENDGTLRLTAEEDDLGHFQVVVTVDDQSGGTASTDLTVTVMNVNRPPSSPVVIKPVNHTMVEEGTNVTFAVDVDDPDMDQGQVLTVSWRSNVSGLLAEMTSGEDLEFVTDALPVGDHMVTVSVTDGEFVREAWFDVSVIERYVPPPPDDGDDDDNGGVLTEPTSIMGILIVVVLVVLVVAFLLWTRSRGGEEEAPPEPPEPEEPLIVPGPEVMPTAAATETAPPPPVETEGPAGADEWMPGPEPEPEPVRELEVVTPPSAEEMAARQHATLVRDVMKTLTQLPRGLPTALWGMDMAVLAKEIVDGPKRTAPDGTELVEIGGKWYTSDHNNVGTFLREHHEAEVTRPQTTDEERAARLEKLEERLLEGDISEETYERLRKKYEGG